MLNLDFFEPNLLPKVELHVHLDTSLSYFYIKKRWPNITLADFNRIFVAQEPCVDLGDFLSKITSQIGILQTYLPDMAIGFTKYKAYIFLYI